MRLRLNLPDALYLSLIASSALASCAAPPDPWQAAGNDPYAVRQETYSWYDAHRQREVPVRLYWPEDADPPLPVIVFSPGVGNSRDGYVAFGQHWAARGYVAVHVTHVDTEEEAVLAGSDRSLSGVYAAMKRVIADPAIRLNRPADLSFVLDRLEQEPALAGRIDRQRIGVAGHSFGAFAALALAGMHFDAGDAVAVRARDPRVKAVVALSPPGPGALGLSVDAWDTLQIPCLNVIGTSDADLATEYPVLRRTAFERFPAADQFLITVQDGTHEMYDTESLWIVDRLLYLAFHSYLEAATTAFFDAYLRDDAQAQDWLLSGALAEQSHDAFRVEYKRVTPIAHGG